MYIKRPDIDKNAGVIVSILKPTPLSIAPPELLHESENYHMHIFAPLHARRIMTKNPKDWTLSILPTVRVTFVALLSDRALNFSFRKSSQVTAAKEFNIEDIEL